MTTPTRERALAALLATGGVPVTPAAPATAPSYTRTGREVDAGGDVARLLIRDSTLAYRVGDNLHYAEAGPGDVVLLSARQAARLDKLGATVDPNTPADEVRDVLNPGETTDEQLRQMKAAELIAHVGAHPEDRQRVRELELARAEKQRRATVLEATEPTPEEDEEAERIAAERAGIDPDLEVEPSEEDLAALVATGGVGTPDSDGTAAE